MEQPITKEEEVKEDIPEQQLNEQEEEKSGAPSDGNTPVVNREPVYKRHAVGDGYSYEFGLRHEDQNVKIEVKRNYGCPVKITIDETEYDSQKKLH